MAGSPFMNYPDMTEFSNKLNTKTSELQIYLLFELEYSISGTAFANSDIYNVTPFVPIITIPKTLINFINKNKAK